MDRSIRVWDIITGSLVDWFQFKTGSGSISLSLVNANKAWVASGSGDYNSQTYTSTLLNTRGPNQIGRAHV